MTVWNDEYCIRQMDMPCTVKGFVALDEDGFSNIYVNSRLSQEEQYKAAVHELRHVAKDDFYNDDSIRGVENDGES